MRLGGLEVEGLVAVHVGLLARVEVLVEAVARQVGELVGLEHRAHRVHRRRREQLLEVKVELVGATPDHGQAAVDLLPPLRLVQPHRLLLLLLLLLLARLLLRLLLALLHRRIVLLALVHRAGTVLGDQVHLLRDHALHVVNAALHLAHRILQLLRSGRVHVAIRRRVRDARRLRRRLEVLRRSAARGQQIQVEHHVWPVLRLNERNAVSWVRLRRSGHTQTSMQLRRSDARQSDAERQNCAHLFLPRMAT
mmetsp:Transcript_13867/g.44416  ORF Transcript_13867/g.44416 Transcript_13867/m.44416 type:complete len:251 (-) Transcript_13867:4-756(-)